MKRYNVIVIGAGPAGLSAAIEAASHGMSVGVFDENSRPGGQLFKQIHKFFGSKEHKAKIRGFRIGQELLDDAEKLGVDVHLNSVVMGIYFPMNKITVTQGDSITSYSADNIILAAGASENAIPFRGWTLPGVMGAGAAQTLMNLYGVQPGEKILMVGSGNVGLVVGFQLLQAGCTLEAVIDAAPTIGGYGVHAAKLARTGVPFYLSHTIVEAEGTDHVTGAVIAQVDEKFRPILGTEQHLDVDTVMIATGLTPSSKLAEMTGCEMKEAGGKVPVTDEYGMTSIEGLYAAGDVSGIEEASSAMIGGRIAAIAAARKDGYISEKEFETTYKEYRESLDKLRKGTFSKENKGKVLQHTDEGYPVSMHLLKKGYLGDEEIFEYPGVVRRAGVHPVIECSQNIPCNPCQDACRFGCIKVGADITKLPVVNPDADCTNCGMCVASCPGQAIFLVNEDSGDEHATVTIPYEFLPLPEKGEKGFGLSRGGEKVCEAEVVSVKTSKVYDNTVLLTIQVPKEDAMKVRFYEKSEESQGKELL